MPVKPVPRVSLPRPIKPRKKKKPTKPCGITVIKKPAPEVTIVLSPESRGKRYQLPKLLYTAEWKSKEFTAPVCLSEAEWNRINDNLTKREQEAASIAAQKVAKEELRKKFKDLFKDWPDTVSNLKKRRLEELKLKQERDEAVKVEANLDEEAYQAEVRKAYMERARRVLFMQHKDVKLFNKAYMRCAIEKERDCQIEFNKKKAETEKKIKTYYDLQDKEQYENDLRILLEEEEVRKQRMVFNKKELLDCMERNCHRQAKERSAVKKELVDIMAEHRRYEMEELKKKKDLKERRKLLFQFYKQQEEEQRMVKQYENEVEKIEDEKRKLFLSNKDAFKKMSEDYRLLCRTERGGNTKLIAGQLEEDIEKFEQYLREEDVRIEKNRLQKEAAADEHMKAEEEKRRKLLESVVKGWDVQVQDAKDAFEIQRLEEFAERQKHRDEYKKFLDEEVRKMKKRMETERDVRCYREMQMERKRQLAKCDKEENFEEWQYIKDAQTAVKDEVNEYGNRLIDDVKKKGWNAEPLNAAKYIIKYQYTDPLFGTSLRRKKPINPNRVKLSDITLNNVRRGVTVEHRAGFNYPSTL